MSGQVVIIGGGAAGFFAALHLAENPGYKVTLLEKGNRFLDKVRVSGGGRCNVTHACFDPQQLVSHYPRGEKELLGPFHHFNCGDTIAWFAQRGVELKTEEDGRMFPVSDSSQTIIDCFMEEAHKCGVELKLNHGLQSLSPQNGKWKIETSADPFVADVVVVATGSSPQTWEVLAKLGHTIIEPVPSLFTFVVRHEVIDDLPGVSIAEVELHLQHSGLRTTGPMLITHKGLSGPAVLKLSAFGAIEMHKSNYDFVVEADLSGQGKDYVKSVIQQTREAWSSRKVKTTPLFHIPQRLWGNLVQFCGAGEKNWADLKRSEMENLVNNIAGLPLHVTGKNTFKEEFVTAGGVDLKEVNMKTMESRLHPGLYFAGEVLNIDAVTGGFNFQAAWTTAWLAAKAVQ